MQTVNNGILMGKMKMGKQVAHPTIGYGNYT